MPSIYSIPKLHKNPYKFRFIAGSKFCSTKELSVLLTKGLQKIQEFWYNYCGRIEATSGINRFWITKNSTELLNTLLGNKKDGLKILQHGIFQLYIPLYLMQI